MFYLLHRIVKWVFVALIAAGLYWVWLQRQVFEPVYAWYDVYENGGLTQDVPLETVEGRVVHIVDGHTFQLSQGNKIYAVRLTGFDMPVPPLDEEERKREMERRIFLHDAVLSQQARVSVTYADKASMLGLVTVNGTNLNIYYLTNNLGRFRPDYIKGLPRETQYQFFAAKRLREKQLREKTALAMRTNSP